jgi:hypothetical protein
MINGMTRGASTIAVALILACAACSRLGGSKDLEALDSAYKAGVLSKEEYDARKAAIQSRAAQLAALDRAREAGLLTDEEYAAKKSALVAAAPATVAAVAPTQISPPKDTITAAAPPPPPASTPPVSAPAPIQETAVPSADPQGHSYRMKLAQVLDAQGFDHPIPSASILIPVDWQSQGATTWNIKDKCNGIVTRLQVSGPDGRAFERFPMYSWVWADNPQYLQASAAQQAQFGMKACDVMAPMGAQDFLRRNLQRMRPNAQLVGFEPAPKLLQDLQQQAQQTEAAARQYNLRQQVKVDAAKARVKYTVDGKPMEEWVIAATVITGTLSPLGQWFYNCTAYAGAQRAPAGQLDASAKLFELIASTFRVNPEWQARVTKNAMAIQQIEQKGIRDRVAIQTKSAEDIRKIQQETYENQQKSQDSINANFSQVIRGVESYRNPTTGETLELDANYGHAWVNNRGEYLLSDQAGFDPNSVPGNTLNWTALQQVKKQ